VSGRDIVRRRSPLPDRAKRVGQRKIGKSGLAENSERVGETGSAAEQGQSGSQGRQRRRAALFHQPGTYGPGPNQAVRTTGAGQSLRVQLRISFRSRQYASGRCRIVGNRRLPAGMAGTACRQLDQSSRTFLPAAHSTRKRSGNRAAAEPFDAETLVSRRIAPADRLEAGGGRAADSGTQGAFRHHRRYLHYAGCEGEKCRIPHQ